MNLVTGNEVISALLLARATKTPGHKAKATKLLAKYVALRSACGLNPVMVEAGIRARVTRILNQTTT